MHMPSFTSPQLESFAPSFDAGIHALLMGDFKSALLNFGSLYKINLQAAIFYELISAVQLDTCSHIKNTGTEENGPEYEFLSQLTNLHRHPEQYHTGHTINSKSALALLGYTLANIYVPKLDQATGTRFLWLANGKTKPRPTSTVALRGPHSYITLALADANIRTGVHLQAAIALYDDACALGNTHAIQYYQHARNAIAGMLPIPQHIPPTANEVSNTNSTPSIASDQSTDGSTPPPSLNTSPRTRP
jgi:hypothetical protein